MRAIYRKRQPQGSEPGNYIVACKGRSGLFRKTRKNLSKQRVYVVKSSCMLF
jgi:hypothetical protein